MEEKSCFKQKCTTGRSWRMMFNLTYTGRGSSQSTLFSGGTAGAKVLQWEPGWHFQKTEWQVCSDPGTQGWLHWSIEVTVPGANEALGSTKVFLFSLSIRRKQMKFEGQGLFVFISTQLCNVIFNIFGMEKRDHECQNVALLSNRCSWHQLTKASRVGSGVRLIF